MSCFTSTSVAAAAMAPKEPMKGCAANSMRTTSRPVLLAASGLFTVAVFLLDAQTLQVPQFSTCSVELALYALGFAATLVYIRFVSKGRSTSVKSTKTAKGKGVSVVESARAARASLQKVCAFFTHIGEWFKCPRPNEPRRTEEMPPVPFWALVVSSVLLTGIAATFFISAFTAIPEVEDPERLAFLDAPFRCDKDGRSKTSRNWTWLIAAFGLSSGLCVVHPLQSGLVLGF